MKITLLSWRRYSSVTDHGYVRGNGHDYANGIYNGYGHNNGNGTGQRISNGNAFSFMMNKNLLNFSSNTASYKKYQRI